jgi:hypothetical protein
MQTAAPFSGNFQANKVDQANRQKGTNTETGKDVGIGTLASLACISISCAPLQPFVFHPSFHSLSILLPPELPFNSASTDYNE